MIDFKAFWVIIKESKIERMIVMNKTIDLYKTNETVKESGKCFYL
jgi:hypothetical protein